MSNFLFFYNSARRRRHSTKILIIINEISNEKSQRTETGFFAVFLFAWYLSKKWIGKIAYELSSLSWKRDEFRWNFYFRSYFISTTIGKVNVNDNVKKVIKNDIILIYESSRQEPSNHGKKTKLTACSR